MDWLVLNPFYALLSEDGAATAYTSYFDIDNVVNPGGGGVTITQMGKVGAYVAGSFSIELRVIIHQPMENK